MRVWKVSPDKKSFAAVGTLGDGGGAEGNGAGKDGDRVRGVVNDLGVFERGDRGRERVCVVAGLGTEHRFGKWTRFGGKNSAVVFEVSRLGDAQGAGKVLDAEEHVETTGKLG